jgi:hypothetical protein
MMQPLMDALRADAGEWEWSADMGSAFEADTLRRQRSWYI